LVLHFQPDSIKRSLQQMNGAVVGVDDEFAIVPPARIPRSVLKSISSPHKAVAGWVRFFAGGGYNQASHEQPDSHPAWF